MPTDLGAPEIPQTFLGFVFAVMAGAGGFFSGRRAGKKNVVDVSDARIEGIILRVLNREREKERHLKEAVSAILDQRLKRLEHPEPENWPAD